MVEIKNIEIKTGFKPGFIYRCLREMDEIFGPLTQKGDKNRKIFDSDVLVIFDQIKQQKEKGLALPEIKKQILKHLSNDEKQDEKRSETEDGKNSISYLIEMEKAVFQAVEKRHKTEIDLLKIQNELNELRNSLRLLPAGGDIEKNKKMISLITELRLQTRAKFFKGREVDALWKELNALLFFAEEKDD